MTLSPGVAVHTGDYLVSLRGAAVADGAIAKANDDALVRTGLDICWPLDGATRTTISIGEVIVSDRGDIDALSRAAHLYLCP
ncbi:hypothetical protein [Microbacterium trichothecenolyticum]|uniref:DUF732 domain-containing protein n=1 Tax=Microbacterium trichothecenolyticum TaxID=69370 RepID=A0ABU0TRQ5_MICTR|nr:hypothetical protein [Microbacterium trichothecenolyticum]MDQ1122145.1 hypothetical protein [Microbacterium trichothecenolyticum]